MNELDERKGIELGDKYRTAYVCKQFASAIAGVSQENISKYVASCNFMSVIVDGSSDSSITENEMVYIHTCRKGEVKTTFIKCCQVQHGTALGVINAIKKSAETVMEFNTILSKTCGNGIRWCISNAWKKVRSSCTFKGTATITDWGPLLSSQA